MNISTPTENPVLLDMIRQGGHPADIANMILIRTKFAEAFQAATKSAPDLSEMREHAEDTVRMLYYVVLFEAQER